MKSIKPVFYLVAEAAVWLIAIWGPYAAIASIFLDLQTTERTYFDVFNEAVAIFPLTLLYMGSIIGDSIILFLLIALSIISASIYFARKNQLLQPHNFSSLKVLLIAFLVLNCLDFARLGLAWSIQSFTASESALEVIKFDDTRYIYMLNKQIKLMT